MNVYTNEANSKHPGGLALTKRMMSACAPVRGTWLDIGCGHGETVRLLMDEYGVMAVGVDNDADVIEKAKTPYGNFICKDAHKLPFENESMDGIIMECTLSLMYDVTTVLHECARILKRDGMLVISDMYAHAQSARMQDMGCHLYTKDEILHMFTVFSIQLFEDQSEALRAMMGQMLLENGADALYQSLGDRERIRRAKAGYYILVAKKG